MTSKMNEHIWKILNTNNVLFLQYSHNINIATSSEQKARVEESLIIDFLSDKINGPKFCVLYVDISNKMIIKLITMKIVNIMVPERKIDSIPKNKAYIATATMPITKNGAESTYT